MKNQFKRLLSLVLIAVMLIPMISVTGMTVTAATYSGECGDNLTWSLDASTGVLNITGTGDMNDYSYKSYNGSYRTTAPWKSYISSIKSVIIGNSVTSIGDYAFAGSDDLPMKLINITIGNSVTSIGSYAFDYCKFLTSVTIPDSVSSIGSYAFYCCKSLTSVTIPDSVSSIGSSAFAWCSSLTSVTIPDSVTSIGEDAFYYCSSLTSVTIPDSVISIGVCAFACCSSLTSVVIGNSVTSIGGAAFGECDSLTSVTIPDSVTSIGSYAFHYYNYGYKPHNITIKCYENSYAHTYAIDHGFAYELMKTLSGTTGDCTWILRGTELIISGNGATSYEYLGGFPTPWGTEITKVTVEEGVTELGPNSFYDCNSLTEVSLPSTLTSIGSGVFYGCTSLERIMIPTFVNNIGEYAFENCICLERIVIPGRVGAISNSTFKNCGSLTDIVLSSLAWICDDAFSGCTSLTNVWYEGMQKDVYIYPGNEIIECADWHCGICVWNPDLGGHDFNDDQCVYCQKKDFPIESIELEENEVFIMENSCGNYDEDHGYFIYELQNYRKIPQFTAVLKDGSVIQSEWGYINVGDDSFYLDNNSWTKQFDNAWTVGNTYDVNCSLYSWSSDYVEHFPVAATLKATITENPIESLEIDDVSIMKNTKGYFDEEIYYYYSPVSGATVTYKDGSTERIYGGVDLFGDYYSLEDNSWHMQLEQPWDIGTYSVTGSLLGFSNNFNVTITEAPIESIEIEDMSIVEGANGYYEDGIFYYTLPSLNAVVTYKDGTTEEICESVEILGNWYSIIDNVWEMQLEETWCIGTYTVTGSLMGVSDTFNVTIIENPIESIIFDDIELIEGVDADDYGEYAEYHVRPVLAEVIFKDGTRVNVSGDNKIEYNNMTYYVNDNSWDIQYEEPWGVGIHIVTGSLMGVTNTFKVTIVENPIAELKFIKIPDKTEYIQSEVVNIKGSVIRINYKDGSYEDIVFEKDYTGSHRKSYYSEKIDRSNLMLVWCDTDIVGVQTVEFNLFGESCETSINVRDNMIDNISIKENEDKTITIRVNNNYDMTLLDVSYIWVGDDKYYTGIFTDKGEFYAIIYTEDDSFAIGITDPVSGNIVKSNVLSSCDWFDAVKTSYDYSWAIISCYGMRVIESACFDGNITADNIDDIASFAADLMIDYENIDLWISPEDEDYQVYNGKDVREAVCKIFGIENIDLTLSQTYDVETDTYMTTKFSRAGGEATKTTSSKISYSNGIWRTESVHDFWNKTRTISLRLNRNCEVISFSIYEGDCVEEKSLASIEVVSLPHKTVYLEGESFDAEGMVVVALYTDGTTEELFDYIVSGYSSNKGIKTITVVYNDMECSFTVTVESVCDKSGHIWSDWITVIEPTYTTEGLQMRYCTVCLFGEEENIPKLDPPFDENKPVITVDNFTVTITNAENIKDMRYALGVYSTTTEIRNAEGNVALDNGVVTANTVNGNFVYTMPNGGLYSIWIRMKDGTNYILPLDVTNVNASVSTYGVKVTVHDIFDVKDIYIAKGEYQTYREIKDNGYIVALTANKIGTKHDYTYTVYEPGVHTILVRYNDGRTALFHETLTVDEPVFTTNGLQITVSNIPDVKVIRTAYGEYNTPGDTKRAEGARNFSSKVIKGAEDYTLQYRENGVVTVVVEYNNGYVKVFHHEIKQKTATMVQTKSVVLFKDLEDFVMIRYAMGEYSTSAEIKRANGSKVIKPTDITNNQAIITGLKAGTYTFCVQFDDESYNYFKVTVE